MQIFPNVRVYLISTPVSSLTGDCRVSRLGATHKLVPLSRFPLAGRAPAGSRVRGFGCLLILIWAAVGAVTRAARWVGRVRLRQRAGSVSAVAPMPQSHRAQPQSRHRPNVNPIRVLAANSCGHKRHHNRPSHVSRAYAAGRNTYPQPADSTPIATSTGAFLNPEQSV